jgi:2-oxoglutarate ferredoxin oxidoreductase subunit alpha
MEKELRLMKSSEAVAEAAIRASADEYFGYPILPADAQYLMESKPQETTGMVVLQAEVKWRP